MMFEIKMPVNVYRGADLIGSGDLLPNGNEMAVYVPSSDGKVFQLLHYATDTAKVEDKIPLVIFREGEEVAIGELLQTGANICVCPYTDTNFNLMDTDAYADLRVSPDGLGAKLHISRRSS